jgi:anionic cell wall polymer biosynthesis LytR-Cps2A-Psr (LCP) family protein
MKNNEQKKQVSLAGAARVYEEDKKKSSPWKWVAIGAALLLSLVVGILLFFATGDKEKPSVAARDMVDYVCTPDEIAGDVSYYILGVTGEKVGDPMDMLAVMCYDRKAGTASVIQMPVDTYIDKDTGFAVDTLGDVWYNPAPEVFCSACRVRVPEDDRDGEYHGACGARLENRVGSATGDLIRVMNEQYGLPIDNYLVLPREGLVDLIDAVDGVQVQLGKKMTLAGESYAAGVHTLDGQAAVEYAVTYNYKDTPASDRERMLRQRQVIAALWQRLGACGLEDLYFVNDLGSTKGILGQLMTGATPIRFNTTSFGKARLLNITEEEAIDMKLSDAVSRFVWQLTKLDLDKVTFSILPGQSTKIGTLPIYSVNRAQTTELLNQQMNPYGLTLDESPVLVPQAVENPKESDLTTDTLANFLPDEKGEE